MSITEAQRRKINDTSKEELKSHLASAEKAAKEAAGGRGKGEEKGEGEGEGEGGIPQRELTDKELENLADVILGFGQQMTGVELYPYQMEFGWRIIFSLLSEDSSEITALFSRQCVGKDQVVLNQDGTACLMCESPNAWKTGDVKPVFRVKGRGGYALDEVTKEHVFFTPEGEKCLGDLKVGDRVSVCTSQNKWLRQKSIQKNISEFINQHRTDEVPVETPLDEKTAILLGFMTSDGYGMKALNHGQSPKFTNNNELYGEEFSSIVQSRYKDVVVRKYKKGKGWDWVVTAGKKTSRGNSFSRMLRSLDWVEGFPIDIFRTSPEIAGVFLNRMFSSDGCIQVKRREIELSCKNSQVYGRFAQALLLKLGVRSSLKEEWMKKSTKPFFRLVISGIENVLQFFRAIGPVLGKEDACQRLHEDCSTTHPSGSKGVGKGNVRKTVLPTSEVGPDGETLSWTRITSIEPNGEAEVWDREVKGKGWFVGQGFKLHNSGKTETVGVVVCGCIVLLPILARYFSKDSRITKFKDGVWCGVYAPGYEQSGIMWARMKLRMYSKTSKRTLLDPDIDIDLTGRNQAENMTLPNGSFVDCGTAAPQAKIEGKTYHLILLEESQDIESNMIRSSIHPMAAAVAGTIVKIGTCNRKKSDFYEACRRNQRTDVLHGLARSKRRAHFQYDYTIAQMYNPRYRKYVEKERERLGEDSDDFRMKYRLNWLLERGMFVNTDQFDECGIRMANQDLFVTRGRGVRMKKLVFTRPANVVTYDTSARNIVASIDVGRTNSTVVTIGKVFWDMPIKYGDEDRFPIHVYNWHELQGDNHEAQHPQIINFLKNYQLSDVIIDATGKGDPVYSRIAAELDQYGINVTPFIFTSQSKDIGYKVLGQEIATKRLTYPAGKQATKMNKWQKFHQQMCDLEKEWRGQTLVVHKDLKDRDARDDYPDSLMMLCWLVNVRGTLEVEEAPNPFIGRSARWMASDMVQDAGAWFKNKVDPRRRITRPSKSGKWD